ncbi:MAG: hypothetical protein J0M12_04100 [Deltaproteobacteria bacterium]|nr:hypothetical protein [Deltaproteobacteria bacterium]
MRILSLAAAVSVAIATSGCVPPTALPPRSALQIREIQTRNFGTADTRLVMKAVLNALQDEGFVTRNAVSDLGLITATKEEDTEQQSAVLFNTLFMGRDAVWPKSSIIEATINVTEFGKETRVRVSFHQKMLDNRGGTMSVTEVDSPGVYQDFFSKVDKSVFLQGAKI